MDDKEVVERNSSGQFLPGQSGNPKGRPPGRKNQLTTLKQDLEIAVRRGLDARKVSKLVEKMYNLAMEGNVQAAKLILDKTISNAKTLEDEADTSPSIRIVIENFTAPQKVTVEEQKQAIDAVFEEVEKQQKEDECPPVEK